MREVTQKLYLFDELTDDAKEKALESYQSHALDYEWWDHVYEDASGIGKILGIRIDQIFFSGFCSHGDGCSIEGSYWYGSGWKDKLKSYAPIDDELLRIGSALQDVQRRHFYKLGAVFSGWGRYHSMRFRVDNDGDEYIGNDLQDEVEQPIRDFAYWIFRQLENEHDYLMSKESISEHLIINEFEFLEDGTPA